MKKKVLAIVLAAALGALGLAGCGGSDGASEGDTVTIKVGATPSPHAEILEAVKEDLAAEGIELEIVTFNDYVQPNTALDNGELDANYFQHLPYMESFNEEKGTTLVSLGSVHYEPMAIYGGKTQSLDGLKDGATIAVPNDTTNEGRALVLLQEQGLITLKEGAGLEATKADIVSTKGNYQIEEIEAAQLPKSLGDVDIAVINGNYAIQNGLSLDDALAMEDKDSEATKAYKNIVAVKQGDEERPELLALYKALTGEKAKQFMEEKYQGSVVPYADRTVE